MADTKDKIKDKIDQGAEKAKDVAGKAVDKTKEAAKAAGEKLKMLVRKSKTAANESVMIRDWAMTKLNAHNSPLRCASVTVWP